MIDVILFRETLIRKIDYFEGKRWEVQRLVPEVWNTPVPGCGGEKVGEKERCFFEGWG